MRIAVTGGTGFVGRTLARALAASGHEVMLVARGHDWSDPTVHELAGAHFVPASVTDVAALEGAFAGCAAVAHCAGINRQLGDQTYKRVHVEGTRNVVAAARRAGVRKIVLVSFLRARPDCGSAYHESKWAAEEIVRTCGLDYTVVKCGVIYGRGDHMLDHLSHAFFTFPVFAFVGFDDRPIRPNAIEDVVRILAASLAGNALSRRTVAVLGPEELTLRQAVRRVAQVVGRRPLMLPLPLWFHYALGWLVERLMKVPLVSVAQVRMLAEGLSTPCPDCDGPGPELAPRLPFSEAQIRKGLPPAGPFRFGELRACGARSRAGHRRIRRVFFELP
jgi:nucleoside-diphosphate-sugar epimerase